MSALSIRHMNHTLQMREHAQAQLSATLYAEQPADSEPVGYFWIERESKTKKGQWIFVRDFTGTQTKADELFEKYYKDRKPEYRLICKFMYAS